jgi:regulator of sigma E protease
VTLIIQIIGALIIFSLLVFIHELGHFGAARLFGVKVNEFAIGMGPAIFKWGKGETKYAIRCIPLGGSCTMEGEDETSDNPRSFNHAKRWHKIVILAAGAILNLLSGLVVCVIMVANTPTLPVPIIDGFAPAEVVQESAVQQAGLQVGDEILRVNGTRTHLHVDVIFETMRMKSSEVDVTYRRGEEVSTIRVNMDYNEEQQRYMLGYVSRAIPNSFLRTLKYGTYEFIFVCRQITTSLVDLVTGKLNFSNVSGPVGIVGELGSAVGDAVTQPDSGGWWNLTTLFLLITINLGIFNLIPFPALDGGRIFFVLVEAIRRKPISPEKEGVVHFVGFALLILLVLFATGNDIVRIVHS